MIELVIVSAIAALLATVAVVAYQPAESNVTFQAERLRNDIRHMQSLAAYWRQSLKLVRTAGYQVECVTPGQAGTPCSGAAGSIVTDPATNFFFAAGLEAGITWGGGSPATLEVDTLGRPVSAGSLLTSDPADFELVAGSRTALVEVSHTTGFVKATFP